MTAEWEKWFSSQSRGVFSLIKSKLPLSSLSLVFLNANFVFAGFLFLRLLFLFLLQRQGTWSSGKTKNKDYAKTFMRRMLNTQTNKQKKLMKAFSVYRSLLFFFKTVCKMLALIFLIF